VTARHGGGFGGSFSVGLVALYKAFELGLALLAEKENKIKNLAGKGRRYCVRLEMK
jgi:hypothetical protein